MRHLTIGRFKSKNKRPRCIKDENGPLMLQTWNLLVYVARLRKKNIILWRTLTKIADKIKVTKLKYLITAWLHSNNPLQRKHAQTEACIYGCRIIERKSVFFLETIRD